MKKRYLWGFTGLLLCGIVGLAEAHDGYRKHSPNRLLIPPQTYVDNCGSCHTAYSALLLPSGSWKRLMGDLPNHFDAAVELDAADKEQIGAWLQGNAADTGTTRRGSKIAKKLHGDTPVRITGSRWFIHKHDDVSQGSIAKAQGLKNCAACHADAQRGAFSR